MLQYGPSAAYDDSTESKGNEVERQENDHEKLIAVGTDRNKFDIPLRHCTLLKHGIIVTHKDPKN